MDNQNAELMNQDDNILKREFARQTKYRDVYAISHPYPEEREVIKPENLGFWRMMGVSAGLLALAGFAAIVASAGRTAAVFATTEYELLVRFWPGIADSGSFIIGFSALVAVEGGLAALGYIRGVRSGKVNESKAGEIISLTIAMLAGLLAGKSLIPNATMDNSLFVQLITWGLVFITGVGIPLLVMIGFENIGYLYNAWQEKVDRIWQSYDREKREAQIEHANAIMAWEKDFEIAYTHRKAALFRDQPVEKRPKIVAQPVSVQKEVANWLARNGLEALQVGQGTPYPPEMIAREIGTSAGNVRTSLFRLRNQKNI